MGATFVNSQKLKNGLANFGRGAKGVATSVGIAIVAIPAIALLVVVEALVAEPEDLIGKM